MEMAFQQAWFERPRESFLSADQLVQKLQCPHVPAGRGREQLAPLRRRSLVQEELCAAVEGARRRVAQSAQGAAAFCRARGRANPYECLGKGPRGDSHSAFINRSALKMANLDHCFSIFGESADQCCSYLDVCGGPGGFSEYVLSKHAFADNAHITGFGISLAIPVQADQSYTSLNWSLEHLHCPPVIAVADGDNMHPLHDGSGISRIKENVETKEDEARNVFFIVHGEDGTGNIFSPRNHDHLRNTITSTLQQQRLQQRDADTLCTLSSLKVDFVCGDGGFDEGKNDLSQEIVNYGLIVCQIIAMLRNLKEGGHFFVKFFATHECRTFRVLLILSHLFQKICIIKPITSRPTSNERYVFGHTLKEISPTSLDTMLRYLWTLIDECECESSSGSSSEEGQREEGQREEGDLLLHIDLHDDDFVAYIKSVNTELLHLQLQYFYDSIAIMSREFKHNNKIALPHQSCHGKNVESPSNEWSLLLREIEETLSTAEAIAAATRDSEYAGSKEHPRLIVGHGRLKKRRAGDGSVHNSDSGLLNISQYGQFGHQNHDAKRICVNGEKDDESEPELRSPSKSDDDNNKDGDREGDLALPSFNHVIGPPNSNSPTKIQRARDRVNATEFQEEIIGGSYPQRRRVVAADYYEAWHLV